jgi:hypothetical protein
MEENCVCLQFKLGACRIALSVSLGKTGERRVFLISSSYFHTSASIHTTPFSRCDDINPSIDTMVGKKKRGHPDVEDLLARPWCYYCV